MERLSIVAEDVLREILDHKTENGECDLEYWNTRFAELPVSQDVRLRSAFKELRESDMISTSWADDSLFRLYVLGKGESYFQMKDSAFSIPEEKSFVNNFYGETKGVQIQQGTVNSKQNMSVNNTYDYDKIQELINTVKKYDAALDEDYGKERADELRRAIDELTEEIRTTRNTGKTNKLLSFIRDLTVNAGGGLIASGILQLISMIGR